MKNFILVFFGIAVFFGFASGYQGWRDHVQQKARCEAYFATLHNWTEDEEWNRELKTQRVGQRVAAMQAIRSEDCDLSLDK